MLNFNLWRHRYNLHTATENLKPRELIPNQVIIILIFWFYGMLLLYALWEKSVTKSGYFFFEQIQQKRSHVIFLQNSEKPEPNHS